MDILLERRYHTEGTNGQFVVDGRKVCEAIELPWLNNQRLISCVPEGKYELVKRYSKRFGHHVALKDVPDRKFILIHPANDAKTELRGCIAPVSKTTGPGKGIFSRRANEALKFMVFEVLEDGESVFLTIKKQEEDESTESIQGADAEVV